MKTFSLLSLIAVLMNFAMPVNAASTKVPSASFRAFDQRAKSGEHLNVVFFGASLTWGANASDPMHTSYRANVARKMEARYPKARFHFFDAAIGGTGSQLGIFRLKRDVLARKPDLVFLDFSANDNIYEATPESLSPYESIVRRLVLQGVPVVQVIFPFKWNVKAGEMPKMKRRAAHLAIARAYQIPVGDAIELANKRVENGAATLDELWPFDGVHPGDKGYSLFAEAAWSAFQNGVQRKLVCMAPAQMLNTQTYMTTARVRLSSLSLPAGWSVGRPNRVSAYFDFLMSRWLDDEVVASSFKDAMGEDGKTQRVPQAALRFSAHFRGDTVCLFGETTTQSGKYRVYIDSKLQSHLAPDGKTSLAEFDAGDFARRIGGNGHNFQVLATGLDAGVLHSLEIEPIFEEGKEQELRFESICVAGGAATIER